MQHRATSQEGFSLIEVVIVLAVMTAIVLTTFQLAKSSEDAGRHVVATSRATEVAQSVVDRMRADLLSSVEVFQNDDLGLAYLGLLEADAAIVPIIDVLPTATFDETFGVETASGARTGNQLMLARYDWTDEYECSSGAIYRIDVYRVVRYHLVRAGAGPEPESPIGLNLARWVSEPLVDAAQIDDIGDDSDRREMLQHLRTATPGLSGRTRDPAEVLWAVGGDPALVGTFRYIDEDGSVQDAPQAPRDSTWTLERDERRSASGLLFYRHFSVATNYAHAGMGVGRYSVAHQMADGFPHGFEVQIVGPSRSRQILLQLCVCSTRRNGLPAWAQLRSVAQIRDV